MSDDGSDLQKIVDDAGLVMGLVNDPVMQQLIQDGIQAESPSEQARADAPDAGGDVRETPPGIGDSGGIAQASIADALGRMAPDPVGDPGFAPGGVGSNPVVDAGWDLGGVQAGQIGDPGFVPTPDESGMPKNMIDDIRPLLDQAQDQDVGQFMADVAQQMEQALSSIEDGRANAQSQDAGSMWSDAPQDSEQAFADGADAQVSAGDPWNVPNSPEQSFGDASEAPFGDGSDQTFAESPEQSFDDGGEASFGDSPEQGFSGSGAEDAGWSE